jgi:glycosyltransferase involved in cell wall biosynthesis
MPPLAPVDGTARGTEAPSLDRVAICSVGELFGGVERHILGMAQGLRMRGISTLLLLFHDGELAAQARQQDIEALVLPDRNLSLWATSRKLAGVLEQRRIALVHVHGYKAAVFCALARRWHRFAMVKTEHGLSEPSAGRAIAVILDRTYRLLDAVASRIAGAAVCYVTEDLRLHLGQADPARLSRVIPNGVPAMDRRRHPRPAEYREEWLNFAVVGRLEPVKAIHVAIEALPVHGVPENVHLHVIGAGPCERELKARSAAVGVAARVHFHGFRRDALDFIAHCDALLMPSLHEGLPYALLEAMALGAPVIASRVGGLAETIQDGATGVLVAPGNAGALADAIRKLTADPPFRTRLGDAAQRLQRAKYTLEAMADSYIHVYRGVLARGG